MVADPIKTISDTLATYGGGHRPECSSRRWRTGGTFTFTAETASRRPKPACRARARQDRDSTDPTVTVDGQRRHRRRRRRCREPGRASRRRARRVRGREREQVSISTVGPTGATTSVAQGDQALLYLLHPARAVSLDSLRVQDGGGRDRRGDPRHHLHHRRLRVVPASQVTPATITAFLTILGFSLYDTVVVFDKVQENQRTLTATGRSTYGEMVNRSFNQVLMRSLSTSFVALHAGALAAVRRCGALRRERRSRTSPSRSPPVCSSVRTRRSSSPRRCSRGGRRSEPQYRGLAERHARTSARNRWRPCGVDRGAGAFRIDRHGGRRDGVDGDVAGRSRPRRTSAGSRAARRPMPRARFSPAPASNAAASGSSTALTPRRSRRRSATQGTLECGSTSPRCGSSCRDIPDWPSRASSSATSRRCWRPPTRSR